MPARLRLYNHQRACRPDLGWLARQANAALPRCVEAARSPSAPILSLEEIEASIVSDERIAAVHGEFLDDPAPTDVITFDHGEILVSADTALKNGQDHGQTLDQELLRCIVHGLLHLGGWEDATPDGQREMLALQERILEGLKLPARGPV